MLIRNLLFQPITINTRTGTLHLLSRKAANISEKNLSPEILLAEERGYIRITRDLKPPVSPNNSQQTDVGDNRRLA